MNDVSVIPLKSGGQRALARQDIVGVIDVGSTKMCCLIGRNRQGRAPELLGASYQLAEAASVENMILGTDFVVREDGEDDAEDLSQLAALKTTTEKSKAPKTRHFFRIKLSK